MIEAVPEKLELKREVFAQLGQLAPEKTIFATNSSSLLPSAMAESTGRPERFLAMHFANEIWVHNTAEIMGHPGTDPAVYRVVVEFARRIGMVPIELKKEQPGYIINSLSIPWLGAAMELLVAGGADPETIDNVWHIDKEAPEGPVPKLGSGRAQHCLQHLCRVGGPEAARCRHVPQGALHRRGQARPAHGRGFLQVLRRHLRSTTPRLQDPATN